MRHGFEELELERIISIIIPENLASRRVAEKAGLTLRGELPFKGHDVVWYASTVGSGPTRGLLR